MGAVLFDRSDRLDDQGVASGDGLDLGAGAPGQPALGRVARGCHALAVSSSWALLILPVGVIGISSTTCMETYSSPRPSSRWAKRITSSVSTAFSCKVTQ